MLSDLRDDTALARVLVRVQRLEAGNPGDVKDEREGVSEMRIDYGPGYRLYYKRVGKAIFCSFAEAKRTAKAGISGLPRN